MLQHGQIEQKEATEMKNEVDLKIHGLQLHQPEIKLMSQEQRIIHLSELSEIFGHQEIEDALEEARKANKKKEQEEIYRPKDRVRIKGEPSNQLLYVARGMLIEKNGEYMDNMVGQLRVSRGRIACLQNLIGEADNRIVADVYCHHSSMASVVPLDLHYLKEILAESEEKLLKYWQILAYRLIILNPESMREFVQLANEKIK
jgi:hypothetical protein